MFKSVTALELSGGIMGQRYRRTKPIIVKDRTFFIVYPPSKFEVDLSLRLSYYSVITDDLLDVNGSGWLHLEADYHTLS